MGVFKKQAAPVEHDDEIRREIRARVAKQVGIYDEEYINTGKIGGKKSTEVPNASTEVAPVSITTEKIQQPASNKPEDVKTNTEIISAKEAVPSAKEKTPAKETVPSAKKKKTSNGKIPPKKKKSSIPLIIFILLLILAFIPFYYYFTGVDSQETNTVLLQEK